MYVLLVSHGPGFIEMPSLDTAKSNKSGLSSLAGCLGGDVGVGNPRPEGWKKVLSPVHLGWGRGWRRLGQHPLLASFPNHSQMRSNMLTAWVEASGLSQN